jgi:ABC-type amino acid transport substrate-binding protein
MKSCRSPVVAAFVLMVLLIVGWMAGTAQAAALNQAHLDAAKIRVGIKPLEPFVFIDENGQPSGFSINL